MKTVEHRRIFLLIFSLFSVSLYAQSDAAHRLYLQAKKFSYEQKWREAADLYRQLSREHPSSSYRQEADFWEGYCLEKAGESLKAYEAFERLRRQFPDGAWSDDALDRQIILAEKLAEKPGDRFYEDLYRWMNTGDKENRFAAAAALARLGDRRALETLKSMRNESFFTREAEQLIAQLEQSADDNLTQAAPSSAPSAKKTERRRTIQVGPRDDRINYFQEKRFEQYRRMTRKDDNWTPDDLVDFALWHILPSEQFDEYISLNREGRRRWLDDYWARQDPTPQTIENECREEFEKRVDFARRNFSYYDGREDFYYAPWDARGEVYIKFGKPDKRTITDEGEFWHYAAFNRVTFFIRPNVTNIFGRAIFISSLDNQTMRTVSPLTERSKWRNFHQEYIFQPGIYFSSKAK
ncbi:MAG: GWxTD domain-containing protein [candidate division KSB1 bacterium]|nr:GWxTD domain-containing protein [candidate division KSB1 bacterium]